MLIIIPNCLFFFYPYVAFNFIYLAFFIKYCKTSVFFIYLYQKIFFTPENLYILSKSSNIIRKIIHDPNR